MKILVADDDPVSRRLLETYLQRWGYDVRMAVDGAAAWSLFQQEDFPLVLSDWMMPQMDGPELIRRIRADGKGKLTYTILVTSKSQKEDVVEGMDAGADDFVTKPFDRDELRVRLREGERTVRLERTLAEQNQSLQAAQAALAENQKLSQSSGAALGELSQLIADLGSQLFALRQSLTGSGNADADQVLHNTLDQLRQAAVLVATLSCGLSAPGGSAETVQQK